MKTFGDRLEALTLSLDNVDKQLFEKIMLIIHGYSREAIGVNAISVLVSQTNIDTDNALVLVREDGKLTIVENNDPDKLDIRFYSYKTGKSLWVVGEENHTLIDSNNLTDLWTSCENLKSYSAPKETNGEVKTSIAIPLKRNNSEIYGVVSFDSIRYEEITNRAKIEFNKIAEAISHLYRMSEYNKEQRDRTEVAIKALEADIKEDRLCSLLKKPTIFLASSQRAEDEVVGAIIEVIESFSEKLNYKYWGETQDSGNIHNQIIEAITESAYGICYFSEPGDKGKYIDNHNVTFEAGMLHALTHITGKGQIESWIPIREKYSTNVPFDFAAERIIEVPRRKDNTIIMETFKSKLTKRIDALVST